jgi:hypothetical protein
MIQTMQGLSELQVTFPYPLFGFCFMILSVKPCIKTITIKQPVSNVSLFNSI